MLSDLSGMERSTFLLWGFRDLGMASECYGIMLGERIGLCNGSGKDEMIQHGFGYRIIMWGLISKKYCCGEVSCV